MEAFTNTTAIVALAAIGDKPQIATFIMAATYGDFISVMSGATVGEMLAITPAWKNNRTMDTYNVDKPSCSRRVCCHGDLDKYLWTGVVARV
jgi:hypothetical protein